MATTPTTARSTAATKVTPAQDSACGSDGGECIDVDTHACSNGDSTHTGKCPGAVNIQCCHRSSGVTKTATVRSSPSNTPTCDGGVLQVKCRDMGLTRMPALTNPATTLVYATMVLSVARHCLDHGAAIDVAVPARQPCHFGPHAGVASDSTMILIGLNPLVAYMCACPLSSRTDNVRVTCAACCCVTAGTFTAIISRLWLQPILLGSQS